MHKLMKISFSSKKMYNTSCRARRAESENRGSPYYVMQIFLSQVRDKSIKDFCLHSRKLVLKIDMC